MRRGGAWTAAVLWLLVGSGHAERSAEGPASFSDALRAHIPADDIAWVRQETARMLGGCRIDGPDGIKLYTPDGTGHYPALWTRDFYYMVSYAGDLLNPRDVKVCINYLLRGQRADGCMPDRMTAAGGAVYSPGSVSSPLADHALDNGIFMAMLVATYVTQSNDLAFFRSAEPALRKGLDHPRRAPNGLVFNPRQRPQCPYGFTDTVAKTGHLLFCSVLYFDACRMMARLSRTAKCGDADEYARRATRIRRNLGVLWNEKAGMFWAADGDCRQIDIWGSALAVRTGCVDGKQADRIAAYLASHYDEIVQRGQVRHLPAGQSWQRLFAPIKPGTYQNGAFWATPIAWVAPTIARRDVDLAVRMVRDVLADFRANGINECVNGSYRNVPRYVASATNVYSLLRALGQRR